MFISRPSEPHTVLLWGDRWWFAGTGASVEFSDLDHAVEVLVAHFAQAPKPVRLRLVFQPDALETVAVACPQGDRATLAAALAEEFPSLRMPGCAWSHEPVLPMGGDFATLLHFETQPGLLGLATRLAQRGLAVDSAWPLATFMQRLPGEESEAGAVTVVALQAQRAVAYRHPADGVRTALLWQGESSVADVGEWLGDVLARHAEEAVLLVCADEETASALGAFVGVEGYPGVEQLTLHEALARPVVLPRYHPAQLLPRTPVVTAQRAMVAASVALLIAAGWLGGVYGRDHVARQVALKDQQARLTALRGEVAQLRETAAEIAALRRSLDGGAAGPPCGALLEKISTTLPAQVTLTSLRITGRSWALDGWVAPGAGSRAGEEWRTRLVPPGAPWTAETKPGGGGSFSLTGGFRP
jgi:hypothetical protein